MAKKPTYEELEKRVKELEKAIFESQKTMQMLKESEEKAKALLNAPTDSSLHMDTDGVILALNQTAAEKIGKEMDELIGVCGYDLMPPYLAKSRKAKINKVVRTGKAVRFEDKRAGRIFDNNIYPVFGTDDKVVAVAVYARDITKEKKAEESLRITNEGLKIKTKSLEELNKAVKVLLEKRKQDPILLKDNVLTNVKELIEPYIEKMRKTELDDHQKAFLSIIESNLNEITSPLTRKLSLGHLNLTPTEIKIANLIRHGTTTKKIAKLMNSSPRTIDTHRKNIRRKMGLGKKRANLRSYLLSIG